MSHEDKERLNKVKKWIVYAKEVLRLAKHALALSSNCP